MPRAARTEPCSELWMAQSVDDWHWASVYSYRPPALKRYVRTMAGEPVESSQCCVSHEPTSSVASAAGATVAGTRVAGGVRGSGGADEVPPHAARSHTASTAGATHSG